MAGKKGQEQAPTSKVVSSEDKTGVVQAIEELRDDVKFSKRATILLGIILLIRVLIVLVITPIQNKTWNRKNAFDVSILELKRIVWRKLSEQGDENF